MNPMLQQGAPGAYPPPPPFGFPGKSAIQQDLQWMFSNSSVPQVDQASYRHHLSACLADLVFRRPAWYLVRLPFPITPFVSLHRSKA